MVSILGTACCNTMLNYILLKETEVKLLLKLVQHCVFVLLNAVYMHPVEWNTGVCNRRVGLLYIII
jgi:hypothetical protein